MSSPIRWSVEMRLIEQSARQMWGFKQWKELSFDIATIYFLCRYNIEINIMFLCLACHTFIDLADGSI